MGFRPEPTVYKLVFGEDTGLAGLHVRARCCTIGEFNAMLRGSQDPSLGDVPDVDENDPQTQIAAIQKLQEYQKAAADANEEAIAMFLKYAVEWDLEGDDGNIVPLTMEGIQAVEKPVINGVIGAWHMAMMTAPPPLKQPSINGRRSEEATLDLANISENLPSWPKQN